MFLGAGLVSAMIGFTVGHTKRGPHPLFVSFYEAARGMVRSQEQNSGKSDSSTRTLNVETSLIDLEVKVVKVGIEEQFDGSDYLPGGGITSFNDEIILLANDGRIHVATSDGEISLSASQPPTRNWVEYVNLKSDPDYADYDVIADRIRYNDISYIQEGPLQRNLIVSYTEFHPERDCVTNSIARIEIGGDVGSFHDLNIAESDWDVVFRTIPCLAMKKRYDAVEGHMSGGKIVYSGKGSDIYLTSGDFHFDGTRAPLPSLAQKPDAQYGKVLKINMSNGKGNIVSSGHRNMQGIVMSANGHVLVAEHGPKGGDEINLILEGQNYGWPIESYGTAYSGAPLPESTSFGRHDVFTPPIFSWVPSIAITNIEVLNKFHPHWNGDLIVGSLKGNLHRLRMVDDRIVFSEAIPMDRKRLRYLHQHTDGTLVLWSDAFELSFIKPKEKLFEDVFFEKYAAQSGLEKHELTALNEAKSKCMECHKLVGDGSNTTLALQFIVDSKAGSSTYQGYSEELKNADFVWSQTNLKQFIRDPNSVVPGSYMPAQDIDEPTTEHLIKYLEFLGKQY